MYIVYTHTHDEERQDMRRVYLFSSIAYRLLGPGCTENVFIYSNDEILLTFLKEPLVVFSIEFRNSEA